METSPSRFRVLSATAALFLLGLTSPAQARRGVEPVFATSANDPVLCARLSALGPGVNPAEARLVASTAFTTGQDMAREWNVTWFPGFQNFLVHSGSRKGGLCFQWATELLVRLDALKLQTLQFHWAESFPGTASEHNVIVMTAIGQPFTQGILLDNWRYMGRLVWGRAAVDPHYEWKENAVAAQARLEARARERNAAAAHWQRAQPVGGAKKKLVRPSSEAQGRSTPANAAR